MKELEKLNHLSAHEINVQDEELKRTHISHFDIKPGQKLWEINVVTGKIGLPEYREVNVSFETAQKGNVAKKMVLDQKPECVYFVALNKKNAERKYLKALHNVTKDDITDTDYDNGLEI